jgi:cobalt-precorrin 5A hydrolase
VACTAEELIALLTQAMAALVAEMGQVGVLAVPDHRADLLSVRQAAAQFALPIVPIVPAALRAEQARCVTHSPRVQRLKGVGSVAEAAALAAAGPGARLLLPRIQSAQATCAVATSR